MFFGNTNAIEPTDAERKRAKEASPIRQATAAEMVAAIRRSAREETSPIKATSVSSKPAPEVDPVAERHGLYTSEQLGGRRYYADYQQKSEIMRASSMRISTRLDDKPTVSAMLDLAESRGWQSVKLTGSEGFRREAWVQAQMRGVATEGYAAKETDKQELARRQNVMERPTATVKAEAPPTAKAIPIAISKPAIAEAEQPEAKEKAAQADVSKTTAKATPKAGKRASKREALAESPVVATPKAEPPQVGAHKAEAGVWNSIEAKGAEAIAQRSQAHRASLQEKAAVARAAQEQKALAAQAARVSNGERAA